ncbi:CASP8-associated protein 2 isoform X2 [Genypterus blacodes]|uniref:CASP8-associated protein 2 isoform X2 n=1 Tax=Genypterus blacodes TaxID=154954 RepID=UPI003F76B831
METMMDSSHAHALLVPDEDEGSVDIYAGLDGLSSTPEKSRCRASPRLRESMDLYEELVQEEQQSRESSYNELKSRYQAAQIQIQELHRRLQLMETQNTGLNTENFRLKKNISALLRTARQEVTRKDEEIQRLNQWSGKGRHHPSAHMNGSWTAKSFTRSSTSLPPPAPPAPCPPPPSALPPLPPSPPRKPPPPPREERPGGLGQPSTETRTSNPSSSSVKPPKCSSHGEEESESITGSSSSSSKHNKPSDPSERRHKVDHPPRKPPQASREEPRQAPAQLGGSSSMETRTLLASSSPLANSSSSSRHGETDKHKESKHRNERHQGQKPSDPSDRRHKDSHASHKDTRRRYESRSGKSRHHASEEPPHSERLRSPAPDNKGRSRERRRDRPSSSDRPERRTSAHSRDEKKPKAEDQNTRPKHLREQKESSSKEHRAPSSKEKLLDKRKEERRSEDEPGRRDKRWREGDKQTSKELDQGKKEGEGTTVASTTSSEATEKSSVEENSPNRKLCFMETLNLTLSPVKKAVVPAEDLTAARGSEDEGSLPDVEDMCVIDEVNSSELQDGCDEDVKPSADDQSSEETKERKDGEKAEDHKPQSEAEEQRVQATSESTEKVTPQPPKEKETSRSTEQTKSSSGGHTQENPNHVTDRQRSHAQPEDKTSPDEALCGTEVSTEVLDQCVQERAAQRSPAGDAAALDIEGPPAKESEQLRPSEPQPSDRCTSKHQSLPEPLGPGDADASATVSSTISPDCFPQEGLSLRDAIYVLTRADGDPDPQTACSDASKVSSTTEETKPPAGFAATPKKTFSPAKRRACREQRSGEQRSGEPSSSLLLHDEDSMMKTLSSLRSIPDAISPLRSPARLCRRDLLLSHAKPPHVKSLRRDFCGSAAEDDSVKLDVNKENKSPGSPSKLQDRASEHQDRAAELLSSLADADLEEGEILSESDEAAAASPSLPSTKKPKLARAARSQPSPNASSRATRKKPESDLSDSTGASSPSPSNKSRFKTVCPAATKASFSTIEEVMETFRMVRSEIRKKYMKLHKTFPRKSFYGMMDNFQKSFLEFVDGAQFGEISGRAADLRSRLKVLVESVFSKVSNNGIVKRIFEQQAVDLKQKLWDFVDVQVDYMLLDVQKALKELCRPAAAQAELKRPADAQKLPRKPQCQQKAPPAQTGLGIRGKDIRMSGAGQERDGEAPPPRIVVPATPERSATASLLDKSDFEILTEQQTSSLTFNLVRDKHMGEIFKCLLQGSDLLESSGVAGETSWSLSTPRKDGESLISLATPTKFDSPSKLLSPTKFLSPSKLLTPTKFQTPSKLLSSWSSLSPLRRPRAALTPALFDESCLLEVPLESRAMLQAAQRTYSILAEDLAVSLTIPSPLKSDSHLSFLQQPAASVTSTPESVISAHISEDALLDGEDATEQHLHLALDTDNSSCGSSSGAASQDAVTSFHFKPDLPMQAVVMERSNDHFIVKIRQATAGSDGSPPAATFSQTLQEGQRHRGNISSSGQMATGGAPSMATPPDQTSDQLRSQQAVSRTDVRSNRTSAKERDSSARQKTNRTCPSNSASSDASARNTQRRTDEDVEPDELQHRPATPTSGPRPQKAAGPSAPPPQSLAEGPDPREETEVSGSEPSLHIAEERSGSDNRRERKRKKHQEDSKAKRRRKEPEEQKSSKKKKKTRDEAKSSPTPESASPEAATPESPSSLSAKNVVRKKGAVVMAWTRDEDRSILLELKTKGASRETFSSLSERLQKPSAQIAERFYQLMKLFKKKEKMDV